MVMWRVGGALFGAMVGLFVAKEFTESLLVCLPAAMAGSCLGIVLSVLVSGHRRT